MNENEIFVVFDENNIVLMSLSDKVLRKMLHFNKFFIFVSTYSISI